MKRVGVFCAASDSLEESFYQTAYQVGFLLGKNHLELVYGGANSGLMEAVARGVHEAGGKVVGVVPRILEDRRKASVYLDQLIPCEDLTERKQIMMNLSDAFLVLPGGVGTLDELFTVMAADSIGYHTKPVLLYNENGFWNTLLSLLQEMDSKGFINVPYHRYLKVVNSQSALESLLLVSHEE